MKIVRVRGATTNIDRAGERLSRGALEDLAEQAQNRLLPIFNQHDHALPPIGRQIKSEVVPFGDGEFALEGTWEIWEPGDVSTPDELGREVAIRQYGVDQRVIAIDASLEGEEYLQDILALKESGFEVHLERRKALDPGSVLLFGLGVIGIGILREIGKDCWNLAKNFVKKVRSKNPDVAKRVIFAATIRGEREVEIDVVLDEPTPEMIDKLFDRGFGAIEQELDRLPSGTARAAFRGDTEQFELAYTVDQNGFPSKVDTVEISKFGGVSVGFGGKAHTTDAAGEDTTEIELKG
ncbi:MAG: hypothetical protein IT363_11165 [Methanoregulaceae archaeon]|nr:hypothetical protein [Methanoregulaceae archaeon]